MQIFHKDIGIEVFYSPWPGNNDRLSRYLSSMFYNLTYNPTKAIKEEITSVVHFC